MKLNENVKNNPPHLLHLPDELEPHAELPEVCVAEELADVVHGQTDEHIEGEEGDGDDKRNEHAVGDEREGDFKPVLVPLISKIQRRFVFEKDFTILDFS